MKKILITTGGSGGHVIPAIILYEHLNSNYEVEIVSDLRGSKFIDQNLYNYQIIDTPNISKNIIFLPLSIILFFISLVKAFVLLKKNKIESIISTGGHMSLTFCVAAKMLKINIYLFEPNTVIGRSNKLMLKFSKKIFCYHENIINFPHKFKNKIVIIERLLRKDIYKFKKNTEKKSSYFKILIIGGSQGAFFFDNVIKEVIKILSKKHQLHILQQASNEIEKNKIKENYDSLNINYQLFNFDQKLYQKIQDIDLAITRSGASALSELIYFNIPFLSIPFPHAKDNHQYYNAKYFSDLNCCWLLEQKKLDTNKILNLLLAIINDKNDYFEKKSNLKKISSQNNWETINQKLISTINEN